MGRGVGAKVSTANDRPLQESDCTFCGSCVDVCPVNALLEADRWRKGREWEYQKKESVCLSCGNGCDITVSTKDGSVVKINSRSNDGSADNYICMIGRFGFDALSSDVRLSVPLKRVGNKLKETTWDDALSIAAKKLKSAGKDAGIIASGSILNEDAAALSALATDVLKTKNIDTSVSLYADADSMLSSDTVDINSADVIMLAGLDLSQWKRALPALDAAVRRRVARGARLIVINQDETAAASTASVSLTGDEASLLAQTAKSLVAQGAKSAKKIDAILEGVSSSEDSDKAAELILKAQSPVIFCSPSLFTASRNISGLSKASVVAVPIEANSRGVIAAGLQGKGKTYKEMISGGVKTLVAVGELPLSKRPDVPFLIVQTPYVTELARQADIVLPSLSQLESSGTIIGYLGNIKKTQKVLAPQGDSKSHQKIIAELSEAMGKTVKSGKVDVKKALKAKTKASFGPFEKVSGLEVDPADFVVSSNEAIFGCSRLLWLRDAEKAAV
jgi:predicted molibdopterin-dependent oxidoreductase YjgC